tara:strand:+ start:3128 stop:3274 length:147 start_codon:yes stop_codon:yes gene_type:complete
MGTIYDIKIVLTLKEKTFIELFKEGDEAILNTFKLRTNMSIKNMTIIN